MDAAFPIRTLAIKLSCFALYMNCAVAHVRWLNASREESEEQARITVIEMIFAFLVCAAFSLAVNGVAVYMLGKN
ncbi:hypothetical protein ACEUZ9_002877 [Paracoccus litorisediminis]|uniref:hypothetical protein n=1 Tax=Paracoccus litorisediminis TaxID=2006130 RepID=UPI0037330201